MKRSRINALIDEAVDFYRSHQFNLPAWALWTPADWKKHAQSCQEIFTYMLGWDITDFGSGDFDTRGLILFTLRNGGPGSPKTYAEKIMMVRENQETPFHFHWQKMEDIINRAGGKLVFELYTADGNDDFLADPVTVQVDGVTTVVMAGKPLVLDPGSSLTLPQRMYHRFYAAEGAGPVLCGEVSMVNDDSCDNRFKETVGRFPAIEEDEPARYLLVSEYGGLVCE
jgi:D-lyxose ketol-isomerase